ncbi:MAG: SPOR domain-containing protein [Balneolaceae bacterium]
MKNVHIFSMALAVFFFSIAACGGESEEEKQARLQAYQDSLRAVEQAKIAEMMEAMQDSIDAADSENVIDDPEESTTSEYGFSEEGNYVVQVGAWRSEEKAQSFVDSWADRNYPNAYVVKTGNELTGDIWFRVRVGNFATRLDAENFGTELATEINSGFWVASKD